MTAVEVPALRIAATWQDRLLYAGENKLRRAVANAITILANADPWQAADGGHILSYDEFAERIVTTAPPPWSADDGATDVSPGEWTDEDTTRTQAWLSRNWRLDLGLEGVLSAVSIVAHKRRVHPVREYLNALHYDGGERVETWLHEYLGAEDSPYTRAIGVCFLVGAVARVMRPGCKLDTCMVLEGEQGSYKSTTLSVLASDPWFVELNGDLSSRETAMQLRSKWIAELSELASLRRSAIEQAKSFLTKTSDNYRQPYARLSRDFPRQCVLAGSTNADAYLHDETGARRFWPVRTGRIHIRALGRDRDQLWAEAVRLYDAGASWYLVDPKIKALAAAEQSDRYAVDAWTDRVRTYLDAPSRAAGVSLGDVLGGALGVEPGRWTRADEMRVAAILRRLNWRVARRALRGDDRVRLYSPAGALPELPGVA